MNRVLVDEGVFKRLRNKYKNAINKAIKASWKLFIKESNNKSPFGNTYKLIKSSKNNSGYDLPIMDVPKNHLHTAMNNLLVNLFPDDNCASDSAYNSQIRNYTFKFVCNTSVTFNCNQLSTLISHLNTKKVPGADNISNNMLKHVPEALISSLTNLFNKCLLLNYFPSDWKTSIVKVLKKPNKCDYTVSNSYRPICLSSNISKLFEKLIFSHLSDHFQTNNIFSKKQHGFIKNKSTFTALNNIIDIAGAFDNALFPAIIMLLDKCASVVNQTSQLLFASKTFPIFKCDS